MAYKTIDETFWTDPDMRMLSIKARHLMLYLMTNPHAHYSGIFYIPKAFIQAETDMTMKGINFALKELEIKPVVLYDEACQVVWVVNMGKYQLKMQNKENFIKGIKAHCEKLHNSLLIKAFSEKYPEFEIPMPDPCPTHAAPIAVSVSKSLSVSKEVSKEESGEGDIVEQVVSHLNTVLETHYKADSKETRKLILGKLDKFTFENFKTVIDKKAAQWKNDPKMCAYLRPETLFGTKFESYLNERAGPVMPYSEKTAGTIQAGQRWLEKTGAANDGTG